MRPTFLFLLVFLRLSSARAAEGDAAGVVSYGQRGFVISDAPGHNTLSLNLRLEPRLDVALSGDAAASEPASVAFRVRRALFRAEGRIARDFVYKFRIDVARAFVAPDGDGTAQVAARPVLDDAQIGWTGFKPLQVSAGQWKVPFMAGWITGSDQVAFAEQSPLVDGVRTASVRVAGFSYGRDIGASVQGVVASDRFDYAVGVFNGAGANTIPAAERGLLTVARAQVTPLGKFAYDELDLARSTARLGVGGGVGVGWSHRKRVAEAGIPNDAVDVVRANADLRFAARGFTAVGELVFEDTPHAATADTAQRLGSSVLLSYVTPVYLAPAVRLSWTDPSLRADDDGVLTMDLAANLLVPDPTSKGATLGHHLRLIADWNTSWLGEAHTGLGHLVTVGAALSL